MNGMQMLGWIFFSSLSLFSVPRAGSRALSLSSSLLERTLLLLIISVLLVTVAENFPPVILRVLVSIYQEKHVKRKRMRYVPCACGDAA